MVWKIIPIDSPGDNELYGGDDTKKINKLLSGYDLTLENVSDRVEIDTPTTFRSEKLKIKSPTTGFNYIVKAQDIAADRIISLPFMTEDGEISLAATGAIHDWGNNLQTFRHQNIRLMNPAGTFAYLLNTSPITSNINVLFPLLAGDDTLVFTDAAQTLNNKTLASPTITSMNINTDSNTIKHSATNNPGDLLVNNGTKFDRKARGTANQIFAMNPTGTDTTWIDQSAIVGSGGGGSSGSLLLPTVGSTVVGAWYGTTVSAGSGYWSNFLTNTSNVSPSQISDGTGRMGLRYNFFNDDDRGGFKTNALTFFRTNDPELWVRYKYDPLAATHTTSTNYRLTIGFTNDVSSNYDTDTEHSLAGKAAFTWYHDLTDTSIIVNRNDGDATQDKDSALSLLQTNSSIHTVRIFGDSTNNRFGISLDGATAIYYDSEIPGPSVRLGCIVQFENEGGDDRSFELYGAYFKYKVI